MIRADLTHTIEFVKEYLDANAKILEVGCGAGRLAGALRDYGYQVTAIDISPERVETARKNGVEAIVADIVHFESTEKFDAVLFSHSLHHINPLGDALEKVKTLLDEKGRILIEDFSVEQMDEKTAEWFYDLRDLVALMGERHVHEHAPAHSDGEYTALAPVARWEKEHRREPPLHTRKELLRVLERKFGNPHTTAVPYLYRYFVDTLETLPNGAAALQRVLELEKKQIAKGVAQPVGLRIVAKKYFSYLK